MATSPSSSWTSWGSPSAYAVAGGMLALALIPAAAALRNRRRDAEQASKAPPQSRGSEWFAQPDLLGSRTFVRDMGRLAEHAMMNDMPPGFWDFDAAAPDAAEKLQLRLRCRETAPFFAPDKVGELTEKGESEAASCPVRLRRAVWTVALKQRYSPVLAEWVDTAVATEKPAAVLLLTPPGAAPLVVVAFRGSKTYQDYFKTDASPNFMAVPRGAFRRPLQPAGGRRPPSSPGAPSAAAAADSSSHAALKPALMPYLADSKHPCTTVGVWRAYAGDDARDAQGASPRARVRAAVEALLEAQPTARVVVTGHSLGAAIATVCAHDLLAHSPLVRAAGPLSLLTFAAPRFFNRAFLEAMSSLEAAGSLEALRVVVAGDVIPRVPPKQLGGSHGGRARLLLRPDDAACPASFCVDDPDDEALWKIRPANDHICHALYLGGETTPGRQVTVPKDFAWPVPAAAPPPRRVADGAASRTLRSRRR